MAAFIRTARVFLVLVSVLYTGIACGNSSIEKGVRLVDIAQLSDTSDVNGRWAPTAAHVVAHESIYLVLMIGRRNPSYKILHIRQGEDMVLFQRPESLDGRGLLVAFAVSGQKQFYIFIPDASQVHSEMWVWKGTWAKPECELERPVGFICDQLQPEDIYAVERNMVDGRLSAKLTRVSEGEPCTVELPVGPRFSFVSNVWLAEETIYYVGYSRPTSESLTRVYFCKYNSDSEKLLSKLIWEQPYPSDESESGLGIDSWLISSEAQILLGFEGKVWSFKGSASGLELGAVWESTVPERCKFLPNPGGLPLFINQENRVLALRIEGEQSQL